MILKSDKISGFLTARFTAPYPRWWIYTPGNASEQSLGVLWELINEYDGQTREQSERTGDVVIKMDFEISFFEKNIDFLATDLCWVPDLEVSEGWDQKSAQFNLLYGRPNT